MLRKKFMKKLMNKNAIKMEIFEVGGNNYIKKA